jgi:adenine deaminase
VRLPPRLRLSPEERRHLVDVAAGRTPADLVVRGGSVLNVFTGRVEDSAVGIAGGRIAWVGDPDGRDALDLLDVDGAVVVPGLIEPHGHPDILYTPGAAVPAFVRAGTTTVCADVAFLLLSLEDHVLLEVLDGLSRATVKYLWMLRGCLDGLLPAETERLSAKRLTWLLEEIPGVLGAAEMTAWPRLLAGDKRLRAFTEAVVDAGLRVDGHCAGASRRTVGSILAAGVTADHEAISGTELEHRLELGAWVMLRHSSLRPDGAALAGALVERSLPTDRVMLTTDGPVPADLVAGHLDAVVRTVMSAGVAPAVAVRMATLNPATYFGLDAHLGAVAPGRCADLVIADSLDHFTPRLVLADGLVATGGQISDGGVDWAGLETDPLVAAELDGRTLVDLCRSAPPLRLEGVITRLTAPIADGPLPSDASLVALVSRAGDWITGTVIHGLAIAALAASTTGSRDVLLAGRDPEAMVAAYRRVVALGGGVVTPGAELPLPVLGRLHPGPLEAVAAQLAAVEAGFDPALPVPLFYLLLFLSIGILPDVRLGPLGLVAVKTGAVLRPPVPLTAQFSARQTAGS